MRHQEKNYKLTRNSDEDHILSRVSYCRQSSATLTKFTLKRTRPKQKKWKIVQY
eukprot:CCRYP_001547-RA/>CCRYP_001547-RA protein AED:0.00 eAED:0.00 QI:31/1/1/1/0/0/2/146/53